MLGWLNETILTLFTLPVHLIFILLEAWYSRKYNHFKYTTRFALINVAVSIVYACIDLPVRLLGVFIFEQIYQHISLSVWADKDWIYWVSLFLLVDLMYWLLHFAGHHVRFLWAGHSIHHSATEFNLTVAIRSSVLEPVFKFVAFTPLAFAGYQAMDILLMYAVGQIYGIFVHTQYIKKMLVWDWFFITPGYHRVHHGTNVVYLDKNLGMVLVIWDRIFGTFQPELPTEPVQYGVLKYVQQDSLKDVITSEFVAMATDVRHAPSFGAKCRYIFGLPGWSHDNSRKTTYQLRQEYYQHINFNSK